ncbi:MAG: DUF4038 domain-containing protein [candidate division KSB1 bacterium]|nr:DUF4038 domain-containing protein [candidate division KSB1 bacterium]MDZ7276436.1 DUF4038 domain-containing protein [candidate division KSB1 bacterium]MDZ7288106.1 DUF4038 domain-containing protein [candidate division KSB1 bacterium]MDZ7300207.1 DUF4038 domain-containing protein [candidate division KSB1 bacterium]MDZ7305778.1 DUF4038 domain-containing protein [candidate division KSB1 bacterium]
MFRLLRAGAMTLLATAASLHGQHAVFNEDFNQPPPAAAKWVFGRHAGNLSTVENGALHLRSTGRTSGWIHTAQKFSLQNKIVQIKVLQPNGDGALGISPTANSNAATGFSQEPNSYRFYTYRASPNAPVKLYVRWSRNREVGGREVAEEVTLAGPCYLRLRLTAGTIHFEYSFDGATWITAYAEIFALPGLTPADQYFVELAADYTEVNGEWVVDDFKIYPAAAAVREQVVLEDPLHSQTLGARSGGQFTGRGWQVTGPEDMIVYDLGRYVENGALTIQLDNFKPAEQNAAERHHVLSMFRQPFGDHNIVENLETLWDLHTGFNYKPGVKLLSFTDNSNEQSTIVWDDWEREQTYHLTVIWQGRQLQYFRNGRLAATHTHASPLALRYLFLGRDCTVSGDFETRFKGNQYPAMIGPVYSNLVVKEFLPEAGVAPVMLEEPVTQSLYANAARLRWRTNVPAVGYVEYGSTPAYGRQTPVLGPPATSFTITLTGLSPNQIYHYRVIALDESGNRVPSADQTFTTPAGGLHLFTPGADAAVEAPGIFGVTRAQGNFGGVNLLAGNGWESYLRFEVTGVSGEIKAAVLRLHGRQSGRSGGNLHLLQQPWSEREVTWLSKPAVTTPPIGRLSAVQAGQWHAFDLTGVITGNGTYDLALIGAGEKPVSFDSRESLHSQPELLVATAEALAAAPPQIRNLSSKLLSPTAALIQWETSAPASAQIEYGLDMEYGGKTTDERDFSHRHSVILTDLGPSKKYHLRALARDVQGHVTDAREFTLTTPPDSAAHVALYEVYDLYLTAANAGENPYRDGPEVTVTFTGVSGPAQGKTITVAGFWDGDRTFGVRFAPTAAGRWVWTSKSNDAGLHGRQGQLLCRGTLPAAHVSSRGHVLSSASAPRTLAYADGTPFFLVGDLQTSFRTPALASRQDFQKYVATRAAQGYNFFLVMGYQPVVANGNDNPLESAFPGDDWNRLNPTFWQNLDQRVAWLNEHGLVAGLPLWPLEMQAASPEHLSRFVRYLINRYAACNVVWVTAITDVSEASAYAGPALAALLAANDPYNHAYVKLQTEFQADLPEAPNVMQPLLRAVFDGPDPRDDDRVRRTVWQTVMAGGFCVHQERTAGTSLPAAPRETANHVMTILRDFWTNDSHYEIRWWEFTHFAGLGNGRWLAGTPGVAYVVYAADEGSFKVKLPQARGRIQGQWFNTKTGLWSTVFSGEADAALTLKPPAAECVAYLVVER